MYFITDYLSTTVKWRAWDIIDLFRGLSMHRKLKRNWSYYVSDTPLLWGQEEILVLWGEGELGQTGKQRRLDCNCGRRKNSCHSLQIPRKTISLHKAGFSHVVSLNQEGFSPGFIGLISAIWNAVPRGDHRLMWHPDLNQELGLFLA